MEGNGTRLNETEVECDINMNAVKQYWFYSSITCSLFSFVGNVLIISVVCTGKALRTTTNCFIANMAISDLFVPVMNMLHNVLFTSVESPLVTPAVGNILCKITAFLFNTSYGVSMASLVVITVHRFYAVAFPVKTFKTSQTQSLNIRRVLLFSTWFGPVVICGPFLGYSSYNPRKRDCYINMAKDRFIIWNIVFLSLFVSLPFLVMFVLYPVIVSRLVKREIPWDFHSRSHRRRYKRNISLTKMFVAIITALLLTYGSYQVVYVIILFSSSSQWCRSFKMLAVVYPFPDIFHVINPLLYFIFCPAYRERVKNMFPCRNEKKCKV